MSAPTVDVTNISAKTEDKEIRDFFSFCGKISSLDVKTEGDTKSATVTFEKDTAAKTALLLNNTQLGASQISVTSAAGVTTDESSGHDSVKPAADRDSDEITQEEKPRSRIIAEYLAHGYVVGDAAITRALDLDKQHGVSTRFVTKLNELDSKFHATDRAKTMDQSYGVTTRANSLFHGLSSYFEKATNTPTGKKLVEFYNQGQKQIQDVHTEARRLAELKKEEHGGSAYKAAGLERVFGAEKAASSGAPSSGPGAPAAPDAATTSATAQPTTSTGIPESTPIQTEKS